MPQEDEYLQTATMYYDKLNSWKADNYAYDWDNKSPALHVLLTQIYPSEMMKCAPAALPACMLGAGLAIVPWCSALQTKLILVQKDAGSTCPNQLACVAVGME